MQEMQQEILHHLKRHQHYHKSQSCARKFGEIYPGIVSGGIAGQSIFALNMKAYEKKKMRV